MTTRILVTGGAGFIGSHLCERLLADGAEVLCVDSYVTSSRQTIHPLLANPRFEAIRHDITQPLHVEVDQIYNLACPAYPARQQHDPLQTATTSVIGALNMLGLAKRLGAPILQASAADVYGDALTHPQTEDYRGNVNIAGWRACYQEGKRCAETLFYDYRRTHGLETRVARIFNTYGPRMHGRDGTDVSSYIINALRGNPIEIHGSGSQTLSMCFVDDLVDGLVLLMNAKGEQTAAPVNLGNPSEVTALQLVETIKKLTGSRSSIIRKPLPADEPRQPRADIYRAQRLLDWQPQVDLQNGLKRTIAYYEAILSDELTAAQTPSQQVA